MRNTAPRSRQDSKPARYVMFKYGKDRYTVSPEKSKVYCNWVEVETSRAAAILTAFREALQA